MNSFGEHIRLTIFGQSHAPAIGMTLEGLPAGERIDRDALKRFLARRAPGKNAYSTARQEADTPEFLCGLSGEYTCGAALTVILRNADARSSDYEALRYVPRPGHADYTAWVKYGDCRDFAGGGQFSGRLTAPLCVAGGICMQLLERQGIRVFSRIASIGDVTDSGELLSSTAEKPFPTVDSERGEQMQALIARRKAEGDSVGGIIECVVTGLPAGLGEPMFDGMENRIASAVFGIPAVRGIEFGDGFAAAQMTGSAHNDAFVRDNGQIRTETNHCGGILGGITTGMPITFRVAFKPTPSIACPQKSVDLRTGEAVTLRIAGRHDPCIVPRAVPCVEAAAALVAYDACLGDLCRKERETGGVSAVSVP